MSEVHFQNLSIPKFYAGRHIFITGGSGFIGKVLIEKILRSCPDVAGLHLLLRAKKGVSPKDRLTSITKVPLFDELRKQRTDKWEDKLHVISGDVSLPGLGISAEDREFLIQNVSVVFHGAASVRFDDSLASAVLQNVRGTRDMALMAKEMPNLAVFLHISTTYCNTDREVIEEKLYPPHGDWRNLIAAAEKLDSSKLDLITAKILGKLPNTYTYSKSLSEHCLHDILHGKPLVIVRPSIVISSLSEPFRGWIDNFLGPVGLMVACGKGLVHITMCRADNVADYAPVDLVVKFILVAAFKHGVTSTVEKSLPVYNCSSAEVKPVTTGQIREMGRKVNIDYPLNDMIWEPLGIFTSSSTVLLLGTIFLHMIPAAIIDGALVLTARRPRVVKLQRRIYAAQHALAPFLLNTWVFKNEKAIKLDSEIPENDRADFMFDYRDTNVEEYFRMVTIGARKYLLKESDDSLEEAREHRKRVVILSRATLILFFAWLLYIIPYVRILTALFQPVTSILEY